MLNMIDEAQFASNVEATLTSSLHPQAWLTIYPAELSEDSFICADEGRGNTDICRLLADGSFESNWQDQPELSQEEARMLSEHTSHDSQYDHQTHRATRVTERISETLSYDSLQAVDPRGELPWVQGDGYDKLQAFRRGNGAGSLAVDMNTELHQRTLLEIVTSLTEADLANDETHPAYYVRRHAATMLHHELNYDPDRILAAEANPAPIRTLHVNVRQLRIRVQELRERRVASPTATRIPAIPRLADIGDVQPFHHKTERPAERTLLSVSIEHAEAELRLANLVSVAERRPHDEATLAAWRKGWSLQHKALLKLEAERARLQGHAKPSEKTAATIAVKQLKQPTAPPRHLRADPVNLDALAAHESYIRAMRDQRDGLTDRPDAYHRAMSDLAFELQLQTWEAEAA